MHSKAKSQVTLVVLLACCQGPVLQGCTESSNSNPVGGLQTQRIDRNAAELPDSTPQDRLLKLSDRFLALAEANDDFLVPGSGVIERTLPDRSFSGVQRLARQAGQMQQELSRIPRAALSHQDQLTAVLLERDLELLVEAPRHYWLFFDITPYNAGYILSAELPRALNAIDLTTAEGTDHYLSLLKDSGRFVEDLAGKLKAQRQRGILLPKAAIPRIRHIYTGLRRNLVELTDFSDSRLGAAEVRRLKGVVSTTLQGALFAAYDRLLEELDDDYLQQAPVAAGLYQYPGGKDYYQYLIRRETSLDLTADQIHEIGLKSMADIRAQMQGIRNQLNFTGSAAAFHQQLRRDKRFYASSPAGVEKRYQHHIDRIKPLLPEYFSQQPEAPYRLARLNPVAEAGMTAGYYNSGVYYYNGSSLDSRSMISAASLIYHELVPGHHFHFSLVRENQQLSPYRRAVRMNAFSEGWANYASGLAQEMGLLDDPYDRYGWLLSDAFIAARLVVDTGLNHRGWSLERASRYMLEHTFSSEEQVATEVLRYSTDIQAQALSYKLGHEKFLEIRRNVKEALGERFDLRKFHAALLSSGTLTMPVLERHIQWYIAEQIK